MDNLISKYKCLFFKTFSVYPPPPLVDLCSFKHRVVLAAKVSKIPVISHMCIQM